MLSLKIRHCAATDSSYCRLRLGTELLHTVHVALKIRHCAATDSSCCRLRLGTVLPQTVHVVA